MRGSGLFGYKGWLTGLLFPQNRRSSGPRKSQNPFYMKDLFPEITHIVHNSFMEIHKNEFDLPNDFPSSILMERMPYPSFEKVIVDHICAS